MTKMPPLSPEDTNYLEKSEFDESLGFALNSVITDIKNLLLRRKGGEHKLAEFLTSRNVKDLHQYTEVSEKELSHLNRLGILTLPSLAGQLISIIENDRISQLIDYSLIELEECEKLAYGNQELTTKFSIIKTRIVALIIELTSQDLNINEFTSDYVKNSIIELYKFNSLPLPETLKAQDAIEIDEDVNDELSGKQISRISADIRRAAAEKTDTDDSEDIEITTSERSIQITEALILAEERAKSTIKAYEEDPSIERIVKEILGIK